MDNTDRDIKIVQYTALVNNMNTVINYVMKLRTATTEIDVDPVIIKALKLKNKLILRIQYYQKKQYIPFCLYKIIHSKPWTYSPNSLLKPTTIRATA